MPKADQIRAAWTEIAIRSDMTELPVSNGPNPKQTLLQEIVALREATGTPLSDFNSFLMALLISDPSIAGTLRSNGKFTVLMPTDAAFNALGATIIDLDDGGGFLTEILRYHILRGKHSHADILAATELKTLLGGESITISESGDPLVDNIGRTAKFVDGETDIEVTNGVIHIIDAVLFHEAPPED